jgi:hypothetical protein
MEARNTSRPTVSERTADFTRPQGPGTPANLRQEEREAEREEAAGPPTASFSLYGYQRAPGHLLRGNERRRLLPYIKVRA